MSRSFKFYLQDILNSINKIESFTQNLTEDELIEDDKTLDAVIYNLMIIGEASKNLPEKIRLEYSYIQWKKIIGLRNIIAHTYFYLDNEVIWDIIENKKLNELKECILSILQTFVD